MAKRLSIEERIAELSELAGDDHDDNDAGGARSRQLIAKEIAAKTGLIVEAAVRAIDEIAFPPADVERWVQSMATAFATLSVNAVKRDPQCRGKLAIAKSLHEQGQFVEAVFVAGVEWVQLEPIWGGSVDAAPELRAQCGLAFAELGHPDCVNVLATLLADSERNARIGAAIGLGNSGRIEAVPLLRYKALTGDSEGEVFSATLHALLNLDRRGSFDFVAQFLGDGDRAPAAALCLGESRLVEAFPLLRDWAAQPQHLEIGFLAIALLRSEIATDFLLQQIESTEDLAAAAALAALETFSDNPHIQQQITRAQAKRPPAK